MSASRTVERVCVIGSSWRFASGISYYTCRMANALAEQNMVSVILMRKLIPAHFYPGSRRVGAKIADLEYQSSIECFDGVDYYWVPSMPRALRFLARQKPNVVVFQWWSGAVLHSYLLLAVAARLLGARVIIEFHEAFDTGEAKYPFVTSYVRTLSRPLLRLAAGFAVHSEYDRANICKLLALEGRPIAVVPHGPNDHLVKAGPPPKVHNAGLCNLLFFGTIRPYKGLEYLIEAFNSLTEDEVRRFRLTVVGETWEGWTLPSRLIASSRYRDRIAFVNRYVTDHEVAEYFSQADAVVLPYLRSSASGPLHMAMSFGLPVAVTDVGGLLEAAREYEGAVFMRPGDADDLRRALLDLPRATGRRYADPHDWARSASLLAELFH